MQWLVLIYTIPPELPDGVHIPASQPLVAGVRPEDLVLEQRGEGVSVRIDKDIDLGHYAE